MKILNFQFFLSQKETTLTMEIVWVKEKESLCIGCWSSRKDWNEVCCYQQQQQLRALHNASA